MKATLTKISTAQPLGDYKPTALDAQKSAAEILLIQVGPLVVQTQLKLAGKGIRKMNAETFTLTERAWETLRASHSWKTHF